MQSVFSAHGGGHAVAAWMLEALKSRYDVTVLTWRPADLARINDTFGTSLRSDQFRWIYPGFVARKMVEQIPDPSDLQKLVWLLRICKGIHTGYEMLLTADGEVDFGRPGIQYVHYPFLAPHYARLRNSGNASGWRRIPATLKRVRRPWMIIGDFSFERMRQNLTLANSQWTAKLYQDKYDARAETLFPPASGQFPAIPWTQRSDEFICVSRLEPLKNHLRIIEILRRVRTRRPELKLRIAGTRCRTSAGLSYYTELKRAVQQNAGWVFLHEDISRLELSLMLARAKYGIHLLPEEHFGMAVAEMASAGAIPFVHNSGGQVEIAGEPELLFDSDDDAVRRIHAVLEAPERQRRLHLRILASRERFAPERFCAGLIQWTESWRKGKGGAGCF